MAVIITNNYGLSKPTRGTRNWDTYLNENTDVIDIELKRQKDKDTALDSRIDNIVASAGTSNTEIVDARNSGVKIKTFTTLDARLEETEQDISNVLTYAQMNGMISTTDNPVYGIEVDVPNNKITRLAESVGKVAGANFDNINAYKRKRCILANDRTVLAYYGETGFIETGLTNVEIIKNGTVYPIGTQAQVMVEQPKFYYRRIPLVLEEIKYVEVNTLTVTAPCTTSGNLTITLNGVAFTVPILNTDNTTTLVATKIRNATYAEWTTSGTGAIVIFTANITGARTTATIGVASTGVTSTIVKTTSGVVGIGFHLRKWRDYVSDFPIAGFKVHPNFVRGGVEYNYIYLPAYEGSIYDTSASINLLADEQIADFTATTGDKLSSIVNSKPASGVTQDLTRVKTRILATNRGTGWQQLDVLADYAEVMLMSIEYATFDFQTAIGLGVVNKIDDGLTNMANITGGTSSLGNLSGMAVGTNGLVSVSYRGRENAWGNIWKWADGLNIECDGIHQAYWSDNGFVDNIKVAPYKNCGFTLAKSNGYISAIGYSVDCDFMYLPSEAMGASNRPLNDQSYQNANAVGFVVALVGGGWNVSLSAGPCCVSAFGSSAHRDRFLGGGLLCIGKK